MLNFIFVFILGASFASFLNVLAKSLPIGENWWSRRSTCPNCQKTLTPLQLIPILSFIWQKGCCKFCFSKISPTYLFVELAGGLLFITPLFIYPTLTPIDFFRTLLFFSLLLTVTLTDLYYQRIPNKILIAFGLPLLLLGGNLISASIGFLFFYGASCIGKFLFKKETIGGGDMKLYFVIGLILPLEALFLSITISSFIALIFVLLVNKQQQSIPFAPFIAIGAFISFILSLI